jgi:ribosomal protein L11 methyltransferase
MDASSAPWTEVRVLVPLGWQELVAETMLRAVPLVGGGAAFGRSSLGDDELPEGLELVRTYLPQAADTPQNRARIELALSDLGSSSGASELAGLAPSFRVLPGEDFAHSWRKAWKPFRVGRLCVLARWSKARQRPGDCALWLEPGAAFGTGRHATTRTCLRLLQRRLQPGERILDAGQGSGILSVAAVLLGARSALGFDVDPNAVHCALDLARDNAVSERCEFREGGFDELRAGDAGFDGVLANLYSDLIQAHARDLRARLRPGGWFVFSGCSAQNEAPTRQAILAAGLRPEETRRVGRWTTFAGRAPAQSGTF